MPSMPAPVITHGAISGAAATATTAVPVIPSHQADDILVCVASNWAPNTAGALAAMTISAGWTALGTDSQSPSGTADGWNQCWWLRATNGSTTNPTVTRTGDTGTDTGFQARVYVIRGCVTSGNPWDAVASSSATAFTTANQQIPACTVSGTNRLVVAFMLSMDNQSPGAAPTGWTAGTADSSATGTDIGFQTFYQVTSSSTSAIASAVAAPAQGGYNFVVVSFAPPAYTATGGPEFQTDWEIATPWNSTTSPKTIASIVVDSTTDVLLVAAGISTDAGGRLSAPTGGTGISWALVPTGGQGDSSHIFSYVWYATNITPQTFTISVARSAGTDEYGFTVAKFSGFGGVGNVVGAFQSPGPVSQSITTTVANSVIFALFSDYLASVPTTRTYPSLGGEQPWELTVSASSLATNYVLFWRQTGAAGSKTVGLNTPTTGTYSIILVELKPSTGPPPSTDPKLQSFFFAA